MKIQKQIKKVKARRKKLIKKRDILIKDLVEKESGFCYSGGINGPYSSLHTALRGYRCDILTCKYTLKILKRCL